MKKKIIIGTVFMVIGVCISWLFFSGIQTETKNNNFKELAGEYDLYRNKSGDFKLPESEREVASLRAYIAFIALRDLYNRCDTTSREYIIANWQFKKLGEDQVDQKNPKGWLEDNFFNSFSEIDGFSAFKIDLEGETKTYKQFLRRKGWIK